jgi:t-SNARE complex subunit (syntaxin)
MDDINAIAKTLNQNTKEQGTKLVQVVANVEETNANAVGAHKEIEKASDHQKTGNKWLCSVVTVVIVCAVAIIIFLIIYFVNKAKKNKP